MKTFCSWYYEKSAPNATVALMGSVVCPECNGNDLLITVNNALKSHIKCPRCHGDGLLTSMLPFSSQLLECAISPTFATELFGGWSQAKGQVIRVINENSTHLNGLTLSGRKNVTVRITDLMKDGLCRCGHQRSDHRNTILPNMPGEECTNEQDELIKCSCEKYEPRGIDLTRKAAEYLGIKEKGVAEVEAIKL